ncbi:hypothetical protein Hamer_G000863 [Homarus americanus]|uniref:Uncharacterized protein n=1 Tax=Homarus americanus TaxID=6706 RepID=A0A8J5N2D6_HOMAM|nr:hypothetical protein Hamer_G000863 [Homarus americanus]
MPMKRMTKKILNAEKLAQEAIEMDISLDRSLQFKRGLEDILAAYKEVYGATKSKTDHNAAIPKAFHLHSHSTCLF